MTQRSDLLTRGLLVVVCLLLLVIVVRQGSDAPSAAVAAATSADVDYLLLPLDGETPGAILFRRNGERLEGLGQIRQGKDKTRYLWTPGNTFEIQRPGS